MDEGRMKEEKGKEEERAMKTLLEQNERVGRCDWNRKIGKTDIGGKE